MSYMVRDEDLPKVIRLLRFAARKEHEWASSLAAGSPSERFARNLAADATRIADEMEAEG